MKKILFISSSWPHGRTFGGQLRALHLARALNEIAQVTVLVVSSDARDTEAHAKTAHEFDVLPSIQPEVSLNRSPFQKLRWALDIRYTNLHGYVATDDDRQRLNSLFHAFDLTWVLNARTPNILNRWHWPRAHLDLDDIPSTYQRTIAQNSTSPTQRLRARVQRVLLRRRELQFRNRFTTLSVCSRADKRYLGNSNRIHIIPNGFECPPSPPMRSDSLTEPRIGFIGLYSYAPNVDGVRWFLKNCWPNICRAIPNVQFRMIGQGTDGPLKPVDVAVQALGWVADPSAEIATWSIMVIPIRYGGGTRIKLAEAFSRKCPVVSTSVGAFGYEVKNGHQLLIADDADHFTRACIQLLRGRNAAAEMAERAWDDFKQNWTWDSIMPKVWGAAQECFQLSRKDRM